MSDRPAQPVYGFAGFRVDTQHRVLTRESGDPVPLAPKVFDTLLCFVERPGELLGKRELLETIWPDVVVEENNLNQCISSLRRALGERAGEHRFVVTEPGRGYRFVADVEALSALPARDSGRPLVGETAAQELRSARSGSTRLGPRAYALAAAVLATLAYATWQWLGGEPSADAGAATAYSPSARTVTFELRAPEGSRFALPQAAPGPALSPDGWQLAFVAPLEAPDDELGRLVAATSVIWIQTLGRRDARPLAGTTGALGPFWSPDGRFVGYTSADGHVRRVLVSGDSVAPEDLAAGSTIFMGGAWNAAGTLLLGSSDGPLYALPEGGEAVPLTRLDASRGEYSHRYPVLLPDGRRFLYLVLSTEGEHAGLYLGSLDDAELKRRVVESDANGALAIGPDGRDYLIYVQNLALLAQPFDAEDGRVYGSPFVVARPVEFASVVRRVPFDAAGRNLVYRPRFGPATRLVWVDRAGERLETLGDEGSRYGHVALSRDGTKLAAARIDGEAGSQSVWWFDLAYADVSEPLTSEPLEAQPGTWMPDGRSLVYSAVREGAWKILRREIGGAGAEEVLVDRLMPALNLARDLTPDGRFLLYEGGGSLWMESLEGEAEPRVLISSSSSVDADLSPDGRWLAFTSNEAGVQQVYVATFPELTDRTRISIAGGSDPQWRGDGRELYYIDPTFRLMAVDLGAGVTDAIGVPRPLFPMSPDTLSLQFTSTYAAAPDGQRFLVVERTGAETPGLVAVLNWDELR